MKKNLLIAVMVLPLLSVSAQWYQTGGTVKVKANTLKYVEGAHEVAGTSTESNEGKVHVNGDFTVGSTAEFRNEWTDATAYGQLIIDDESVASGNVISEYKNTDYNAFYKQSTAFPFTGVSAEEFAVQAGIETLVWPGHPGNGVFNNTRWRASVNTWDNQNYALDDMLSSETIETNGVYGPQRYYSINQMVDELQVRLSDYQGTPANTPHNLVLTSYTISAGAESVVNNYSRNIFGEMLGTYLKDAFVTIDYDAWSTNGRLAKPDGFAENLFYFGNPYTSNLDLRPSIPTDGSVVGIQQFSSNTFDPDTNEGNSNLNIDEAGDDITTFSGGSWTGDGENVLEVRPFHTFAIKTNGSLASIDLNDSNKTFNLEFNAPSYVDRTTGSNSNPLNQVKLQLFQDDLAISKSYIVAGTDFEAAAQAGNEAYNSTLSEEYASIYTLQENEDGTVNSELSNSLTYINGINELNYVAKPVMMALNIIEAGDFVLKGILSDDILNSSNKFFFQDTETGFIEEIGQDFEYAFSASESSLDRFRVYWNGLPESLGVEEVAESAKTIVYKDTDKTFKIRFSSNWATADVYIYNLVGQLVHSAKNVNAKQDYTLQLSDKAAAYVVKSIGDNGEVSTSKIVK